MPIVCITGHPGTGKTTLLNELIKLGYTAYGLDEEKIAMYYDLNTNLPTVDVPTGLARNLEWRKTNVWMIDMAKVRSLKQASGTLPTFIFCNGYNVEEVWDFSDEVIILQLNPSATRERLISRTSNSFGSHPGELELAIQMSKTIDNKANQYPNKKVHYIDASQRVEDILSNISLLV